jgi:hypothetical protein
MAQPLDSDVYFVLILQPGKLSCSVGDIKLANFSSTVIDIAKQIGVYCAELFTFSCCFQSSIFDINRLWSI